MKDVKEKCVTLHYLNIENKNRTKSCICATDDDAIEIVNAWIQYGHGNWHRGGADFIPPSRFVHITIEDIEE